MQINEKTVIDYVNNVKILNNCDLSFDQIELEIIERWGHSNHKDDAYKARIRHEYTNYEKINNVLVNAKNAHLLKYQTYLEARRIWKFRVHEVVNQIFYNISINSSESLIKIDNKTKLTVQELSNKEPNETLFKIGEIIANQHLIISRKSIKKRSSRYVLQCLNCGHIHKGSAKALHYDLLACGNCYPSFNEGSEIFASKMRLGDVLICKQFGCYIEEKKSCKVASSFIREIAREDYKISDEKEIEMAKNYFNLNNDFSLEDLTIAYTNLLESKICKTKMLNKFLICRYYLLGF